MEFIAAIITFIAGYLGATMGAVMNWPDAGAIVAITVMGAAIIYHHGYYFYFGTSSGMLLCSL